MIHTLLQDAIGRLATGLQFPPDKPEETADSAARALWLLASGHPCSAALAIERPTPPLTDVEEETFRALVERRLAGTPLAYLTGRQHFLGLELLAGTEALIPRRETELLGRAAVGLAQRVAGERGMVKVVDVCTGSGNLALAVSVAEPRASVFASDLSEGAIGLARRNVERLGVIGRVTVLAGDLFAPFDTPEFTGRVDLVTCNPPYISTARVAALPAEIGGHEPVLAFDGGPLGVLILQRLVREAPRLLRPGGWLAFEVGLGQGPAMAKKLEKAGPYSAVECINDDAGNVRVLLAQTVQA